MTVFYCNPLLAVAIGTPRILKISIWGAIYKDFLWNAAYYTTIGPIILLMGTFDRSLMTNDFVEILVSIKKRLY